MSEDWAVGNREWGVRLVAAYVALAVALGARRSVSSCSVGSVVGSQGVALVRFSSSSCKLSLKVSDEITAVDGRPVKGLAELSAAIVHGAKASLEFRVQRRQVSLGEVKNHACARSVPRSRPRTKKHTGNADEAT